MRRRATAALAALALAAAGCGGDSEGDAGIPPDRDGPDTAREDASTPTPEAANLEDTSVKPEIPKPTGEAPSKLEVETIVDGSGPKARRGDTITVHYVGVTHSTGEQFDASWDRGQPFTFQLGGRVIEGWNTGLRGARAGERRRLTIPPDMAYGAQGAPPDIGPNEALVFVVDVLEVS